MTETRAPLPQTAICPVCGLPGITPAVPVCPQCDANLQCFHALDQLATPAEVLADSAHSNRALLVIGGSLLGAVLLLLAVQLLLLLRLDAYLRESNRPVPPAAPRSSGKLEMLPQSERIDEVAADRTAAAAEGNGAFDRGTKVVGSVDEATAAPETAQPAVVRYHARPEDTLWGIAARFYGRGEYYPLLLHDNPNIAVHRVGAGVTFKLVGNRERAPRRYRRLIHRDEHGRFWYYSLRAGDCAKRLASNFFGTDKATNRIKQVNPDLAWEIGQRVKIYLP